MTKFRHTVVPDRRECKVNIFSYFPKKTSSWQPKSIDSSRIFFSQKYTCMLEEKAYNSFF